MYMNKVIPFLLHNVFINYPELKLKKMFGDDILHVLMCANDLIIPAENEIAMYGRQMLRIMCPVAPEGDNKIRQICFLVNISLFVPDLNL